MTTRPKSCLGCGKRITLVEQDLFFDRCGTCGKQASCDHVDVAVRVGYQLAYQCWKCERIEYPTPAQNLASRELVDPDKLVLTGTFHVNVRWVGDDHKSEDCPGQPQCPFGKASE